MEKQVIHRFKSQKSVMILTAVLLLLLLALNGYEISGAGRFDQVMSDVCLFLLYVVLVALSYRRRPRYIALEGQNLVFKCVMGKKVVPVADIESLQPADYERFGAKKDRPHKYTLADRPYAGYCQRGTEHKYWICSERRDGHALVVTKDGEQIVFDCDDIEKLKQILGK